MRLIDANALKKCACEWCNTHYSDEPCEPSECIAMLRIDEQPTVDAVEVVRCKKCKHLEITGCYGECGRGYLGIVKPWDFCSYGERKDNELLHD